MWLAAEGRGLGSRSDRRAEGALTPAQRSEAIALTKVAVANGVLIASTERRLEPASPRARVASSPRPRPQPSASLTICGSRPCAALGLKPPAEGARAKCSFDTHAHFVVVSMEAPPAAAPPKPPAKETKEC